MHQAHALPRVLFKLDRVNGLAMLVERDQSDASAIDSKDDSTSTSCSSASCFNVSGARAADDSMSAASFSAESTVRVPAPGPHRVNGQPLGAPRR